MKIFYYNFLIFASCFFILIFPNFIKSQGFDSGEFMIVNKTGAYSILIKMYPIGSIFNGNKEYNIKAINPIPSYSLYLLGIQDTLETSDSSYFVKANFDDPYIGGTLGGLKFSVGYGLYKIEFWKQESGSGDYNSLVDTCYMDWRDSDFRSGFSHYHCLLSSGDLRIDYFSEDSIAFKHYQSGSHFVNIRTTNRHIKYWQLMGTDCENSDVIPTKGPFYSPPLLVLASEVSVTNNM